MSPGRVGHLPEADEGERGAAPVAAALAPPRSLEQAPRLVEARLGELEVGEARPRPPAPVAPDPLEVLRALPRAARGPRGVAGERTTFAQLIRTYPAATAAGDVREWLQRLLEREPQSGRVGIRTDDLGDVDERRDRLVGVPRPPNSAKLSPSAARASAMSPATQAAAPSE